VTLACLGSVQLKRLYMPQVNVEKGLHEPGQQSPLSNWHLSLLFTPSQNLHHVGPTDEWMSEISTRPRGRVRLAQGLGSVPVSHPAVLAVPRLLSVRVGRVKAVEIRVNPTGEVICGDSLNRQAGQSRAKSLRL
jgi:hypothetical protein